MSRWKKLSSHSSCVSCKTRMNGLGGSLESGFRTAIFISLPSHHIDVFFWKSNVCSLGSNDWTPRPIFKRINYSQRLQSSVWLQRVLTAERCRQYNLCAMVPREHFLSAPCRIWAPWWSSWPGSWAYLVTKLSWKAWWRAVTSWLNTAAALRLCPCAGVSVQRHWGGGGGRG